jgi:2-amino-4-hydroxy-6-hydroxymethyldihydropteridine diphosphokinase
MNISYLSLGTNLGDRSKNLQTALEEIREIGTISKKSSIYQTEPEGFKDQDQFLNQVLRLETELEAIELIVKLQEIEHRMGKNIEFKDGPRLIDIDIIFFNDQIIDHPNLKIPHPRATERNFILTPMKEIAPKYQNPHNQKSIEELLNKLTNPKKVEIWT